MKDFAQRQCVLETLGSHTTVVQNFEIRPQSTLSRSVFLPYNGVMTYHWLDLVLK